MDCHINNNTLMRVFRDQDIFKHRAPISKIIQTDDHANWDRSYYDFGHYNADCLEGRLNFKARYPIMLTPKRMEKI